MAIEGTGRVRVVHASDPDALKRATQTLRAGGLVALPTETVYGLAADMRNRSAVARVFSAKGRPTSHPLIVHLATAAMLEAHATSIAPDVRSLLDAFWPGPLSVLLRRRSSVPDDVVGGRPAAAFRVPANAFTRRVIAELGGPVVAPSANRFGEVSPTEARHVVESLGSEVDLVIDDGACPIGVESTVLDATVRPMQVLRPGGVLVEEIEAVLGRRVAPPSGEVRAPGMLASHYAPRASLLLANEEDEARCLLDALSPIERPATLIGCGIEPGAYAASLYASLRDADDRGVRTVVALVPPPIGIGRAVADRLARAAGRRPLTPR